MTDNHGFYRAFEDRMRGSQTLIRERLQIYTPFLSVLAELSDCPAALDIGCGRGEWLEELIRAGFSPLGIDMDQGMLALCQQKGLPVEEGDGIKRLAAMPDKSLALISAFHLVEHLSFDQVQKLVMDALRVLSPGGLLILETPNPENLTVGAHTFYQDPTHERPIPPDLLAFLPEYYGFARVHVMRLQQGRTIENHRFPTLSNVLLDVSPDYAVLAYTAAPSDQSEPMDKLFELECGIDLHGISQQYDSGVASRFQTLETDVEHLKRDSQNLENHLQNLESNLQNLVNHAHSQEMQLQAMYNSRSWRITRPLRKLSDLFRSLSTGGWQARVSRLFFSVISVFLNRMLSLLRQRPKLYRFIYNLCRLPGCNVLLTLYRTLRMRHAQASWEDKPFLSDRTMKNTELPVWMHNTRELSTSELLLRIRKEILQKETQEIQHED